MLKTCCKKLTIKKLGRCDRLGRTGVDREVVEDEYQEFLTKIQYMASY